MQRMRWLFPLPVFFCMGGCTTFPRNEQFDSVSGSANLICVDLTVKKEVYNSPKGDRVSSPNPYDHFDEAFQKMGVDTKCPTPARRYQLDVTHYKHSDWQFHQVLWMVASVGTFGIIPYKDTKHTEYILKDQQTGNHVLSGAFDRDLWAGLFLAPAMLQDSSKYQNSFGLSDVEDVIVVSLVSQKIREVDSASEPRVR